MRFRGLLFGFAVVLCSGCGAGGFGIGAPQGHCRTVLEELNRVGQSDNRPADPQQLEELVDEALPCMSASDLAPLADAWFLDEVDLPEAAVQCLQPRVDTNPDSFVIVTHNQTHRLPSAEPHHQRWVTAMAECVPASYVMNSRLPVAFTEPESLSCYDEVYEPMNLLPYFENINTFDDRVGYSDWPEAKLRTFFGPMYQCADFLEASLGSDFIAALSDPAIVCMEGLMFEFLPFTREWLPEGYNDAYRQAVNDCVPEGDVQALRDAGF